MDGTVWCRNIETEETKKFRLKESEFLKLKVGSRIILRDDGWFDCGNNFVTVLKDTERGKGELGPWESL